MQLRRIPSTQALRSIESFARHGKVWQVADELNLTRSAVSHQLRALENDLGFQILNRIGNSVELTQRGHTYAKDVRKALNIVISSAIQNASDGACGLITISCPPGFATGWLCLNIGRFTDANPDVSVTLSQPRRLNDMSNPNADIFIAFGRDFPANAEVELLKRVEFTPLCSPTYLEQFEGFTKPEHLKNATLLHLENHKEWEEWHRIAGQSATSAQRGIIFEDVNLAYSAAIASQGITMGDEFVYKNAMDSNLLVRPFDLKLPCDDAYYITTPHQKSLNSAHHAFLDWIKTEMAA